MKHVIYGYASCLLLQVLCTLAPYLSKHRLSVTPVVAQVRRGGRCGELKGRAGEGERGGGEGEGARGSGDEGGKDGDLAYHCRITLPCLGNLYQPPGGEGIRVEAGKGGRGAGGGGGEATG